MHGHKFGTAKGGKASARFKIKNTLFDGKCLNCILGNSATTRCPVCGFNYTDFHKDILFLPKSDFHLDLGLGNLRVEIKMFEQCVHVSYKKKLEVWEIGEKNPSKRKYCCECVADFYYK